MDASDRKELGAEIRAMRAGQNLSQKQLAEKADVSVRAIRNLEAGRTKMQPGNLGAVLDALGYQRPEQPWDDSVDAFLQMVGWRLTRLSPDARTSMIGRITLMLISDTD